MQDIGAYEKFDDHARMLILLRKVLISLRDSGRNYFEMREVSKEIDLMFRAVFDVEKYVKRELTQTEKDEITAKRELVSASPQDEQTSLL